MYLRAFKECYAGSMLLLQFTVKIIHFAPVVVFIVYPVNRCFCFAKKE